MTINCEMCGSIINLEYDILPDLDDIVTEYKVICLACSLRSHTYKKSQYAASLEVSGNV